MNNEHQKLLNAIKPNPLPSRQQYEQMKKDIDKDKPQFYARDRYGIERYIPNFLPSESQAVAIAKIRNIKIIRRHGKNITIYTPKGKVTNEKK